MKLFNSLSRALEEIVPINPPMVTMYTCGPTVYDYATIGNWRTYVLSDLLVRCLTYLGYQVKFTMNLTDVGHLTGDNVGDADTGEDRLEKAAKRERKTAWDVANFYSLDFVNSYDKLNLTRPIIFSRATEHIAEQIDLIGQIEAAGFTYKINDGIYFDVRAYEKAGNKYGELSTLDEIKAGARVEVNKEKRDPRDFALWKFSPPAGGAGAKRDMEWESPWGVGFPGWHVECSAMSMKYLGEQMDLHAGGEDLKSTHHPNEIAQSEAATGKKPFVKYWVHGAFLLVDGGKMGKSLGNAYSLHDVEKKGFDPLALRYFYLTGHYRKQLNFTWEALAATESALKRLRGHLTEWKEAENCSSGPAGISGIFEILGISGTSSCAEYEARFKEAIENDLDMPAALAIVWELVKSDYPDRAKKASLFKFDTVLGLELAQYQEEKVEVSPEAKGLLEKREALRGEKRWGEADRVRKQLEEMGYAVRDEEGGAVLVKNHTPDV